RVGQPLEEGPVGALALEVRFLGLELDGLALRDPVPRRADVHAHAAARAVVWGHLDDEGVPGERLVAPRPGRPHEALRRVRQQLLGHRVHAYGRVRAGQGAEAALRAGVALPDGYLEGDGPLLPPRRVRGVGAVDGERRHGERVALPGDDAGGDALDEVR